MEKVLLSGMPECLSVSVFLSCICVYLFFDKFIWLFTLPSCFLALNLPLGKTTVMHLIIREHIPGEGSYCGTIMHVLCLSKCTNVLFSGTLERDKSRQESGGCDCCVIL
jgi:hypothetical protein